RRPSVARAAHAESVRRPPARARPRRADGGHRARRSRDPRGARSRVGHPGGAGGPRRSVLGSPRPLLLPRRELPDDRRGSRPAGRHDREPHLALPRQDAGAARGKKRRRCAVWSLMSENAWNEERLGLLLGMLTPAPRGWVEAAAALPRPPVVLA